VLIVDISQQDIVVLPEKCGAHTVCVCVKRALKRSSSSSAVNQIVWGDGDIWIARTVNQIAWQARGTKIFG
jgi:hypothetical protein